MASVFCMLKNLGASRLALLGAIIVFGLWWGCGAEGREGPDVHAPYTDHGDCPTTNSSLKRTRDVISSASWQPVRPQLERILVDDGGIRVLVPAFLYVAHQIDLQLLIHTLSGFEEKTGLARMSVHLRNVVAYFIGESPHIEGAHYGALDTLHVILQDQGRNCDVVQTMGAFKRILALEVDGEPWIEPTFDALLDVANDAAFQELLEEFEFAEESGGEDIAVGREAFILVMRLLTANMAEENFDLDYFRDLINDLIVLQLPQAVESQEKLDRLIDYIAILMQPDQDIFPYLQSFVKCVNDVDEDGELPGMVYDYLSIEELSLVQFLEDIDTMGNEPAGQALRPLLIETIGALENEPQLLRDSMWVADRFLEPSVTREIVPALSAVQGTGLLTELIGLFRNVMAGCSASISEKAESNE
jgi:hypothetical protein